MNNVNNIPFKLGTFSAGGSPSFPGVVIGDQVIALLALQPLCRAIKFELHGVASMINVLQDWESNIAALTKAVNAILEDAPQAKNIRSQMIPLASLNVRPPVDLPRQIICTGANYFKHVADLIVDLGAGATPDSEGMNNEELRAHAYKTMEERVANGYPYAFGKLTSSVTGPYDNVVLPYDAEQPDWELELAVVIGRTARRVSRDDALSYVAGYTIANDITNRDKVYRKDVKGLGTDWVSAKSAPTYLPLGPYLVPSQFIRDPQDLQITLKLNGQTMQDESTSDMIFNVARQIEYISSQITLLPGDVICTGSPSGNGTHYGRFLRDGDVMEGSISGLGSQRNLCVNERQ